MSHQVRRETLAGTLALEAAALEVDLADAWVIMRNDAVGALAALRKGSFSSTFLQQCAMRSCRKCNTLFLHAPGRTLVDEGVDELSRARALRPYAERLVTFAKKAAQSSDKAVKLHYYRLAIAKLRNEDAAQLLFKTRAPEFLARNGGYTRIYKLGARKGDAAEQALIELVAKDDKTPAMTPKAKVAKQPKAKKEAAAAQA
jgi:ribosomal protein L17